MPARVLVALVLTLAAFSSNTGPVAAEEKQVEPKKIVAPYQSDHEKALEAKQEVVEQLEDYTKYRVEFNGIKGDRVPGFLYVPRRKADAGKASFPAILLQYGTGGNKTTNYIIAIGKQFASHGYVVLTIDSPNCGERKKEKGKKAAVVLGLVNAEQVMHYCGDYSRAVDFLASRPEVDKERLGYVGISWGAITGITYVAYDQRIKAMGSLVGGGNFLGSEQAKITDKAAEVSKSSDPIYHVARIAPRPLLFINVTKDQLIMKPWAESLHRAAGPGSKVEWLETDHYFRGLDRAAVCNSVIDFMDKALSGAKK